MRYTLRNKKKIAESFDHDFVNILDKSLKEYSETHEGDPIFQYESEGFPVIHIPSVHPRSECEFEFYVIKKVYDVYTVAYKSVIG